MLNPGILNRRIKIQSSSTSLGDYGQVQTWSDLRSCWAAIHTATSKEVYAAAGFVSELSHVITIRYSSTQPASAGMRVSYSSRSFRVQAVTDPDEGHEMQQLLCLEIANA